MHPCNSTAQIMPFTSSTLPLVTLIWVQTTTPMLMISMVSVLLYKYPGQQVMSMLVVPTSLASPQYPSP